MTDSSEEGDTSRAMIRRCNILQPVNPVNSQDREMMKKQLSERCLVESQKLNKDTTRLVNLKEQCSMLLINYLTLDSAQQVCEIKHSEK